MRPNHTTHSSQLNRFSGGQGDIRKVDLAAEREKRLKAREIIVQPPAQEFRKNDFLPRRDNWLK